MRFKKFTCYMLCGLLTVLSVISTPTSLVRAAEQEEMSEIIAMDTIIKGEENAEESKVNDDSEAFEKNSEKGRRSVLASTNVWSDYFTDDR